MFIYSLTTFFIVVFQNFIWDHASFEYKYVRPEAIGSAAISRIQIFCNLDMVNAVLATGYKSQRSIYSSADQVFDDHYYGLIL